MSHHGCPERLSNRAKGFGEDGGNQTMEVLVETLTGTAFEITVSPTDTVLAIKSKICRVEGIPVSQQHLVHNLVELSDSQSLVGAGVRPGARLRLVLGLRGGPIGTRHLPSTYTDREDQWSGCGSCRVALVVLRDGRRVRLLPLHTTQSPSLPPIRNAATPASTSWGSQTDQNAVTMNKMAALRQQIHDLTLKRRPQHAAADMQKTRSEETLSAPFPECADDTDDVTDYTYLGCSFADRYTLLPPLSSHSRAESAQSISSDELQLCELSDALVLTHDDSAILEECLDGLGDTALNDQSLASYDATPWHSMWSLGPRAPAPRPATQTRQLYSSSTSSLDAITRTNRVIPPLSRHRNREHLHLSDEGLHLRDINTPAVPPGFTPGDAGCYTPGVIRRPRDRPLIDTLGDVRPRDRLVEDMFEDVAAHSLHDQLPTKLSPELATNEVAARLPACEETTAAKLPAQTAGDGKDKGNEKKPPRLRCSWCRVRVTIATVHWCRCGRQYCAPHRYKEVHGCQYDYKAHADTAQPPPDTRLNRI